MGVGDAENDLAMLDLCGVKVAVANALPSVRETADLVTRGARGEGVAELVDRLIATDLAEIDRAAARGGTTCPAQHRSPASTATITAGTASAQYLASA